MNTGDLIIQAGNVGIHGILNVPNGSGSLVIFSHDSGSSRYSPRNKYVASVLNRVGISTLLIDLLTDDEDTTTGKRFDVALLTSRLICVTELFINEHSNKFCRFGYFGACAGAASALVAATKLNKHIDAIVLRGGRTDLAAIILPNVKSPTLLVVGELDYQIVEFNENAFGMMRCDKSIQYIPHATHLYEEPGALEKVAQVSCDWFTKYLLMSEINDDFE